MSYKQFITAGEMYKFHVLATSCPGDAARFICSVAVHEIAQIPFFSSMQDAAKIRKFQLKPGIHISLNQVPEIGRQEECEVHCACIGETCRSQCQISIPIFFL